jgi:cytochrome c oxidase assembly factor 7
MAGFEVDCADGKGEASACHYVAEFYAAVKEEYGRAGAMYAKNCKEKKYGPSCFSLGRFHCEHSYCQVMVVHR